MALVYAGLLMLMLTAAAPLSLAISDASQAPYSPLLLGEASYVPVVIKGHWLKGLRSDHLLVGVWGDEGWLELPFTTLPLRPNAFTLGLDILYGDRPLRSLDPDTANHVLRNLDKLLEEGKARILNVSETMYARPAEISPEQGILVLLPTQLLLKPHPRAGEWSPEALRLGYTRRAAYTYKGVDIEAYYPGGEEARGRVGVLPVLRENTRITLIAGMWRKGEMKTTTLIHHLDPAELYRQAAGIEAGPTGPRRGPIMQAAPASPGALETLAEAGANSGAYLWYLRYWRSGVLSNETVGGSSTVTLTDYFTTKANTSRYDIHLVLRPLSSTGRTIHVEAYVNGSLIIYDDAAEASGVSYEYLAYVWSPDPGDISNNTWEVKVILTGLDPQHSRWLVDATPTARAWIQPATQQNEVRPAEATYYGISSVKYSQSDEWFEEGQYEINPTSGDAILAFTGASNIVEGLSPQWGLAITVKSTEMQRYDRYVRIYVNDHDVGLCLAYAPGIPNGTAATRGCTIQISDISPYIAESLRENTTPIIRIVVEGYIGSPGYDYRNWFILSAFSSFYTRSFGILGNTMYDADPTQPPSSNIYRYVSVKDYYIGASYGYSSWFNTDMQQTLEVLGYPPHAPGLQTYYVFKLNIPLGSRWPADADMSHRLLRADISIEVLQEGTTLADRDGVAYVPQGSLERSELLDIINIALRVAATLSQLSSSVPGIGGMLSLGLQITNLPTLFYRGATYTLVKRENDVRLTWDTGYSDISTGEFTIKTMALPSTPWNSNPVQINVQGYVQVYVSKSSPLTDYILNDSVLSLDVSRSITIPPGG